MRDELYRLLGQRGVAIPRAVYDSAGSIVSSSIAGQVTRFVFGPRAQFARGLRDDPMLARAEELLRGATTQKELLGRAKKS
jgi:hypothetical protein